MDKDAKKKICGKRWLKRLLVIAGVLLLVIQLPVFAAMAVMGVYNQYNIEEDETRLSKLDLERVEVTLPGGLSTLRSDYFPFVMTYCDAGFANYAGAHNYKLTIQYNFGAYEPLKFSSSLFDEKSVFYNSFYGAYNITDVRSAESASAYGFNADGTVNASAVAKVPEYDFYRLVLSDFGLTKADFEFDWCVTGTDFGYSIAGYDDWVRIDADLTVSGAKHQMDEFVTSYLQYGYPIWPIEGTEFESVAMKGTLFARYFEEEQTCVYLYAICTDEETLSYTIENYLLKAKVI